MEAPALRELVDVYLAQHHGEPETVAKLRWLLAKAVRVFGHHRISQLRPAEIAAWRMTIPAGHRFEATQALRQVLARAVSWGMIDVNPEENPFSELCQASAKGFFARGSACERLPEIVQALTRSEVSGPSV